MKKNAIIYAMIFSSFCIADCDTQLKACKAFADLSDKQISNLHTIVEKQATYLKIVEKQRDDAYDQLQKTSGSLPWWVWGVVGVAGGVVLTRGLR